MKTSTVLTVLALLISQFAWSTGIKEVDPAGYFRDGRADGVSFMKAYCAYDESDPTERCHSVWTSALDQKFRNCLSDAKNPELCQLSFESIYNSRGEVVLKRKTYLGTSHNQTLVDQSDAISACEKIGATLPIAEDVTRLLLREPFLDGESGIITRTCFQYPSSGGNSYPCNEQLTFYFQSEGKWGAMPTDRSGVFSVVCFKLLP